MKLILFVYFISFVSCACSQSEAKSGKDSVDQFAGTTPCSNVIRPLHKIKPEDDCALDACKCVVVEWKLILYKNPVTQEPTSFKLTGINKFTVPETNMLSQPGTKTETEGKWSIIKGSKTNPEAIVYRLNPDKPVLSLSFVKLGNNLLHVLDHEGQLMIGNEFWNYTLSRINTSE